MTQKEAQAPLHIPVLLKECLEALRQMPQSPKLGLDLTFGRGGHSQAILQEFAELKTIAVDQDLDAISAGQESMQEFLSVNRMELHHCNFHHWLDYAQKNELPTNYDFILMDLGVSSPQLDTPQRGFSFYHEGPLDMRMDQSQGQTAADIVNSWDEEDLNSLFKTYGEIRSPYKVSREIVNHRKNRPFKHTLDLSGLIERLVGWRKKGMHPATQYFMALRLYLNNELEGLKEALPKLMSSLNPQGRLLVITFHSLEDRIVKQIFKGSEIGRPVNKKVIKPTREEELENKRSRSAHLRIFEKGE